MKSFKVTGNLSLAGYGQNLSKSLPQTVYDFIFFPLRCVLPYKWVQFLGLTDLGRERRRAVIPYLKGKILDVGCGPLDELKKEYHAGGEIIGVDIMRWEHVDLVCAASDLAFQASTFDCVIMMACLNHIQNPQRALREALRVLKTEGKLSSR